METKFTPGPWSCGKPLSDTCDYEVIDAEGNVVAGEYGILNHTDARLIAAAPELYAALHTLLEYLGDGKCADPFAPEDYNKLAHKARSALAKARGES